MVSGQLSIKKQKSIQFYMYSKEIKQAWESKKSIRQNLEEMGLSYDPNKTIKIPNNKAKLKVSIASNKNEEWHEENITEKVKSVKAHVAEELEKDAKAPRAKLFRLPNSQVEWITYLLDKYGDDFKAMARDRKNYYQETWKQIRAKIKRFKSIPEQYLEYLKKKGITEVPNENESYQDDDSE